MWAIVTNNTVSRVIRTPVQITVGSVTYPRNIFTSWSKANLATLGILPYREVSVDSKYNWQGTVSYQIGDEVVATFEAVARDLDTVKSDLKSSVKTQAAGKLSETDWMVIRAAEGGTPVSAEVTQYRADVRAASNTMEAEIDALEDLDAVKAYELNWPVDPLAPVVEEEVSE